MKCPKCGGDDWHDILEHTQQSYKQCGNKNCKYSPSFDKVDSRSASSWVLELEKELNENQLEFDKWDHELAQSTKQTTLQLGNWNKYKRLLDASEKKMRVAQAVSAIVAELEQGQITIHAPEFGMLVQFEWGDFNLFKSLKAAQDGSD